MIKFFVTFQEKLMLSIDSIAQDNGISQHQTKDSSGRTMHFVGGRVEGAVLSGIKTAQYITVGLK